MPERRSVWTAYADGSCIGNPGRGGWGVVLIAPAGSAAEYAGAAPATTNNRMELTAALEALRRAPAAAAVALHSDSQYLVKTMTLGWKRRENLDLWTQLDREAAGRLVRWEWVRGHHGHPLNERADELARAAAENRPPRGAPVRSAEPETPAAERRSIADKQTPLLRPDETIRLCECCRRQFVAAAGARFCTAVPCQREARGGGTT